MATVTVQDILQSMPVGATCAIQDQPCNVTNNCPAGTWFYQGQIGGMCMGSQTFNDCVINCSEPNISLCPQFGTQSATSAGFSRNVSNNLTPGNAPLACIYPATAFTNATLAQMTALTQYRSTMNTSDYNTAFNQYCFQEINQTCPVDATTNQQMTACSRVSSTGDDGTLCRQWLNNTDNTTHDSLIQSYCSMHQTADCKCATPTPTTLYNQLNAGLGLSGQPQCWWVPCETRSGAYLVPSTFENQTTCPSGEAVCERVDRFVDTTVVRGGQINANDVASYTGCDRSETDILAFLEKYWWIIFIIVGGIIFLVIIIALIRRR